jgi:excinuclease UvrABC ATPase subunit
MKKCKHCDGEGKWEVPTISTHDVYQHCEYCNGTGIKNKELAKKVKKSKEYKPSLSAWEMVDEMGLQF